MRVREPPTPSVLYESCSSSVINTTLSKSPLPPVPPLSRIPRSCIKFGVQPSPFICCHASLPFSSSNTFSLLCGANVRSLPPPLRVFSADLVSGPHTASLTFPILPLPISHSESASVSFSCFLSHFFVSARPGAQFNPLPLLPLSPPSQSAYPCWRPRGGPGPIFAPMWT